MSSARHASSWPIEQKPVVSATYVWRPAGDSKFRFVNVCAGRFDFLRERSARRPCKPREDTKTRGCESVRLSERDRRDVVRFGLWMRQQDAGCSTRLGHLSVRGGFNRTPLGSDCAC